MPAGENRLLSWSEMEALLKLSACGDEDARRKLIVSNIALVKSILKKFLNRGHEYDDLLQVGTIGLIKAIDNYSAKFGVRFSTYAVPMIMGEIKRFLRDDGMIRVSRSLKEKAGKAMAAREKLKTSLGREPTLSEIAIETELSVEDLTHALEASRTPASIYDTIYEDDERPIMLIDRLPDDKNELGKEIDKMAIADLMERLNERERLIIKMRYYEDRTQSQIADKLGISQVQVSRLEKKVLMKMRNML